MLIFSFCVSVKHLRAITVFVNEVNKKDWIIGIQFVMTILKN